MKRSETGARSAPPRQRPSPGVPGAKPGKLPAWVEPCLATPAGDAPTSDKWVHEIKLDGYRLQARIGDGGVRLITRGGQDWTQRFAGIAKALRALKLDRALIDGEVVVQDVKGASSFVRLVEALQAGRSKEMLYYAFDLLHLDGMDLMGASLLDRKALLRKTLRGEPSASPIRYCDHVDGDGAGLLEEACKHGLEGIISKRKDKPYRSGRRDDWLKVKCTQTDEFVIAGYLDSTAQTKAVGALVLGAFDQDRLVYVGRVGTGFTRRLASRLWKQLQPLRVATSAFAQPLTSEQRRSVLWVRPELVGQIAYRSWTGDGLLRHAAFKGLREDKPATEVNFPRMRGAHANGS